MLIRKSYHQPDTGDRNHREAQIDQKDRAGKIFKAERQRNAYNSDNRTQNGGFNDIDHIDEACETPHSPVALQAIQADGFC